MVAVWSNDEGEEGRTALGNAAMSSAFLRTVAELTSTDDDAEDGEDELTRLRRLVRTYYEHRDWNGGSEYARHGTGMARCSVAFLLLEGARLANDT